ncbi:MAG TPA: hypothetical protein VF188_08285 [Longimicrobiales bacterium]
MPRKNPFGEEEAPAPRRVNPFGEEIATETPGRAAERIEQAARRIRGLRSRLGSEGLTVSGTRDLIDDVATALEAAARALRGLDP